MEDQTMIQNEGDNVGQINTNPWTEPLGPPNDPIVPIVTVN